MICNIYTVLKHFTSLLKIIIIESNHIIIWHITTLHYVYKRKEKKGKKGKRKRKSWSYTNSAVKLVVQSECI